MGKSKRGYNAEARQVVQGKLTDQDEVNKLAQKVTTDQHNDKDDDGYGRRDSGADPNALALPAKKRSFKKAKECGSQAKLLSRKRRKHLEKIVEQKKKKTERGELIEKLRSVQVRIDFVTICA